MLFSHEYIIDPHNAKASEAVHELRGCAMRRAMSWAVYIERPPVYPRPS